MFICRRCCLPTERDDAVLIRGTGQYVCLGCWVRTSELIGVFGPRHGAPPAVMAVDHPADQSPLQERYLDLGFV